MSKGNVLVALAALLLLGASPARAEWRRAESPNFIVYGNGSEAWLRDTAVLLEDFDSLLRFVTGITSPAPNKLHVYMVRGTSELKTIRPIATGVAGFYMASPDGIAAVVDVRGRSSDNEFLFHEYTHHFMMQYMTSAYPPWYIEGFAEYFMTAQFTAEHAEFAKYSKYRIDSIVSGKWLPMERVLYGTARDLNLEQAQRFYAQSWLAVHYFFSTGERIKALQRFFLAVARGEDQRTAFESETGLSAQQLTAELKSYVRGRRINYKQMPRSSIRRTPSVTVTTMPRSATDLMLYEAALRIGLEEESRDAQLEKVRRIAARHPADPFARRVLAWAEACHGDAGTADTILDDLLSEAPDDAELMYLKGMSHLNAAGEVEDWQSEMRAARQWFARAHQVDGNHYQTLYRYAQSLRGQANYVSENTANVLLLARELAPQVVATSFAAADMLVNRGEYQKAESILTLLAADAHNEEVAQTARDMIERARSQGQSDLAGAD